MPIEDTFGQIEYGLSGLDMQLYYLNQTEEGLAAWWNPVDWVKGAHDTMESAKEVADILKQQYTLLRQMFAQGQATFMEIMTFWRGLIGAGGDIESRIKSLKTDRGKHEQYYNARLSKIPAGSGWDSIRRVITAEKNSVLRQDDAQIKAYDDVLKNIKTMTDGLWGPKSPWGQAIRTIETTFTNFTKDINKYGKDVATNIEKSGKELVASFEKVGAGVGRSFSEFTKAFDNYTKEFKRAIDGVSVSLANIGNSSAEIQKAMTAQLDAMAKALTLQNIQMKEMQSFNADAKKYYEAGIKYFERSTDILKSIDEKLLAFKVPGA